MSENKPASTPPAPQPAPTNQVVQKSAPPAPKPAPQNVFITEGSQRVERKKG